MLSDWHREWSSPSQVEKSRAREMTASLPLNQAGDSSFLSEAIT